MVSSDSQLSFGFVDGRPVFMDEQADSYFRLDAAAEAEFLALAGEKATAQPRKFLLDALGLSPEQSVSQAQCPRPAASLLDEGVRSRPTFRDVAKAALAVRSARRALACEPIGAILARFGESEPGQSGVDTGRQLALAGRFLAARRLVPVRTNCLLDSIAILRWLGAAAAGTSLVFAVKLDPFGAHCWLQTDRLLINDRIDIVEPFVPVRVIRCSAPGR